MVGNVICTEKPSQGFKQQSPLCLQSTHGYIPALMTLKDHKSFRQKEKHRLIGRSLLSDKVLDSTSMTAVTMSVLFANGVPFYIANIGIGLMSEKYLFSK